MEIKFIRSTFSALVLLLGANLNCQAVSISDAPAYLSAGVPPLVMLDISKDQQLFKKAYNDYSDLDGDGQLETDYKHSINYYGYFDPYKCYTYTSSRFVPSVVNTDKYCASGTAWSGNFLNWVSTTRMDAVRKLLYGGLRVTPESAVTILERAYLPTDAHSWAKYYNGTDINRLTPFASIANAPTGVASTTTRTIGLGSHTFTVGASTTQFSLGDQVIIRDANNPNTKFMTGAVGCVNGTGINMYNGIAASTSSCAANEIRVAVESIVGAGTINNWSIENWSQVGITICNTTLSSGGSNNSQTNTNPPLMRVAKGNFGLWAANERWQCYWREDSPAENLGAIGGTGTNGNRAAISGLYASSLSPNRSTTSSGRIVNGLTVSAAGPDFNVRVEACKSAALIGTEKCRQYPDGNYKPIGLLQTFGESDLMRFGLMTGSYNKNISGGVLRKNIGKLDDEINFTTDGTFKTPPAAGNIINTLNKLRIYGYNYADGTYLGSGGDNCPFQLTSITEGFCTSWGNPMSEIFYETLRYFAGKAPNNAYIYGTGATIPDNILGLPLATWNTTLLSNSNYCAPLNTIVFNASVSTNDDDLRTTNLADINTSGTTAEDVTNAVGTGEGITGTTRYVGKIIGAGATGPGDAGFELCTAKTIPGLGQVSGICPEGPTLAGSYLVAGLAYQANINRIRADLSVPTPDTTSLKVKTYGVQLATNVPQIRVAVAGESTPRVVIQPAYRLVTAGGIGGGTLVDLRIVEQTSTATTATGTIYLNWEDSEQGGDYDQDVWGVLKYSLNTATNTITVTTQTIAQSTANPQGFGYIITGTTRDGPHFHSGILNFNFADPTNITVTPNTNVNVSGGCNNCNVTNAATTASYTLGASTARSLEDPLFYAAKWGGFSEAASVSPNNLPDLTAEFDQVNNTTGLIASDGVPDNYFLVSNPLFLEQAMTKAFLKILATSAASAVATSSTSLQTESLIFQATFNPKDWSGKIQAFSIGVTGTINPAALWDGALRINAQVGARQIITFNKVTQVGMDFTWANINSLTNTSQKDVLNKDGAGVIDNRGEDRVGYLRGVQDNEGVSSGKFRERPTSRLGDIVFSNPQYVGAPNDGYFDSSYAAFRNTFINRTPMLYVGANDGMLHGFNACFPFNGTTCKEPDSGKELIAYVPGKVYNNLSKLTDQNYTHKFFVDGSPTVADAFGAIGGTTERWRSVLVSGLNAGGQGVFALDVTDPGNGTLTGPGSFNASVEGISGNILLWEFTNDDDADLGYTYSKPLIKRVCTARSSGVCTATRWAAIFGNGYNSTAGTAALYVLYLDKPLGQAWGTAGVPGAASGKNFVKIDTGCNTLATGCSTGSNGLSSVADWDNNGDGNVDYVYAGDLQGNLWKFDLSGDNPSSWKVAIGTSAPFTPLFKAVDTATTPNRQPIATAPIVTGHPITGILVLFGTGKILHPTDISDLKTQTFYGIWDKNDGSTVSDRGQLLKQNVISETGNNRVSSNNPINWRLAGSTPPDYLGWYIDLVVGPAPATANMKGERHVGTPQLFNGVLLFNTYIPSTVVCDFSGTGFLMALNFANGGQLSFPVFDSNGDGSILANDSPTSGLKVGAAIGGSKILKPKVGPSIVISNKAGGSGVPGPLLGKDFAQLPGLQGRVTWHELLQR